MSMSVRGLSYRYKPDMPPILRDVNHKFRSGHLTAITGPSGCGKSTLLYLLGLMLQPTSGVVMIDDEEVSSLPDVQRSRIRGSRVGFVFQDAVLDPSRSVMANVLEGALFSPTAASSDDALKLLAEFGVDRRATHRPGEISGGQAQRVALCRALVKRPKIVLADEPTGNLDRSSGEVVWNALQNAASRFEATVIVATHDEALAAMANEVLRLEVAT